MRFHLLPRERCACAILLLGCTSALSASGQSFRLLQPAPFDGFESCGALAVSADGHTVGGYSDASDGRRLVVWNSLGSRLFVGELGGGSVGGVMRALSSDGTIGVGESSSGIGSEACAWTSGVGLYGLGPASATITQTNATGVNADGTVIVGLAFSTNQQQPVAFRWTPSAGYQLLGTPPDVGAGSWSSAAAVSADGSTIVGQATFGQAIGNVAFRWTEQTGFQPLGHLPGGTAYSAATAVSADGSVVVGWSNSGFGPFGTEVQMFRWTASTGMISLGDLPGGLNYSQALAVSGDGSIVVGTGSGATDYPAVIWDAENGLRRVSDVLIASGAGAASGYYLQSATAISTDGRVIVGSAATGGIGGLFPRGWRAELWPQRCIRGDLDGNGTVDLADLARLLSNFGSTGRYVDGDLDVSGTVDLSDLARMLSDFGFVCG